MPRARTFVGAIVLALAAAGASGQAPARPNVLMIAVDDLRDWTEGLGGYGGEVRTPNLTRLAERGVEFTNAHAPAPLCSPSRTAVLTGRMPSSTGVYDNGQWWRPHLGEVATMPVHFRARGYVAAGAGKIFHHTAGFNPPDQWDAFRDLAFDDDPWFRASRINYPQTTPTPEPEGYPFGGVGGLGHEVDWGALPDRPEAQYDDARSVDWAIDFLEGHGGDEPFFLACGTFRPHLPWYVPAERLAAVDPEGVVLPAVPADDLDDVPAHGRALVYLRAGELRRIRDAGALASAARAYLASIEFADAQIGRLLDALDASPHAGDTVVVLWSDHGWHLGEKDHLHKQTLWEVCTRVPFLIAASGDGPRGVRCDRPVGLIDLYPTLLELCGLPAPPRLDGTSLVPLLANPSAVWAGVAVTENRRGEYAVRSQRYRYIRYCDGGEELYDHAHDPHEWVNLAGREELADVVAAHRARGPRAWAAPAPHKKAYRFDPKTYQWERR